MAILLDHRDSIPLTFLYNRINVAHFQIPPPLQEESLDENDEGEKGKNCDQENQDLNNISTFSLMLENENERNKTKKKIKISKKKSNRVMTNERIRKMGLEEEGIADPLSLLFLDLSLSSHSNEEKEREMNHESKVKEGINGGRYRILIDLESH